MPTAARSKADAILLDDGRLLPIIDGVPIVYEDEPESEDMGEVNLHTRNDIILLLGYEAHLRRYHPELQAFANLNLYYWKQDDDEQEIQRPFVAPDVMIMEPFRKLPEDLRSYTIGKDGPAPRLTTEVLSEKTAELRDLATKPVLYAFLKIPEYILVDPSGDFLPDRLLLKRLQPDGTWKDERDADGGVTSELGLRITLENDGKVRVIDAKTGRKYLRPEEADQRIRDLEAELKRLRSLGRSGRKKPRKKPKD